VCSLLFESPMSSKRSRKSDETFLSLSPFRLKKKQQVFRV
jgi:hypothetical protein